MPNDFTHDDDRTPSGVRRRTVLGTAAWAAPIIASSVATPAFAASSAPKVLGIVSTASPDSAARCGVIPAGSFRFQTLLDGKSVGGQQPVIVSLPEGLRFAGATGLAAQNTSILPDPSGLVSVPAIQATGSTGTYSVNAHYEGASAFASILVTGTSSSLTQVVGFGRAEFKPVTVPVDNVRAIMVSDRAYGFIDADDAFWLSGESMGVDPKKPVRVMDNVKMADLRAIHSGQYYVKVAVVDTSDRVFIEGPVNSLPKLLPNTEVTGFTGTVLGVKAFDNTYFVHTTDGVFYSGEAFGVPARTARLLPGSAGAESLALWAEHAGGNTFVASGAFVNTAGELVWFTASQGAPTIQKLTVSAPVQKLGVGNQGLEMLDINGDGWVSGASWNAKGSLVKIGSGYTDMDTWSRTTNAAFNGVAFIGADGGVYQAMGNKGELKRPEKVKGLEGTVTRIFASDGSYQVLTSDGSIFSWINNNDTGIGTASKNKDLNGVGDFVGASWNEGGFWGFGIALSQSTCTIV